MQWFDDNKDWLFSGIGVFVLGLVFRFVVSRKRRAQLSQEPGGRSLKYQVGGDGGKAEVLGNGQALGGRGGNAGSFGVGGKGGDARVVGAGKATGGEAGNG